ncbi:hypothetical protein SDC9_123298 [bioreactor metagenome]|uniref:Uncharacterized protein n=1 Tax=bioreactor metagenome TaxID=1076179 RepID=A0A645CH88_9ZZZZ
MRILGRERAVGTGAVDLGGVAVGIARVHIGQHAHVPVHIGGLELVAAVEVGFQRVAGQPVHGGVPVAHVEAAVAERVVKTALQRGLDGLGAAGVLVLTTELVVGSQGNVGGELGMGPHGGDNSAGQGGSLGESLETACSGTRHSGFLRFENFVAKISDELSKHRPCQSLWLLPGGPPLML